MSIYANEDYKIALYSILEEKRKQFGLRFTLQKMAEYCFIQKTYLSRFFNADAQLSEDQTYLACEFLNIPDEETEFILLLRSYSRCKLEKRKQQLLKKIQTIQNKTRKTESHIGTHISTTAAAGVLTDYYLDPNFQLAHLFFTIPRFATDPDLIADCLHLSREQLLYIIQGLQRMNLLEYARGKYKSQNTNLHLPSSSPLYRAYRLLHRAKSAERIQSLDPSECYSFSVIFSADETTRKKLHEKLLRLVKEAHLETQNAKEEEVYQLNLDLFNWS